MNQWRTREFAMLGYLSFNNEQIVEFFFRAYRPTTGLRKKPDLKHLVKLVVCLNVEGNI